MPTLRPFIVVALAGLGLAAPLAAQPAACEPALLERERDNTSRLRYQPRDDRRCEGTYSQQVSRDNAFALLALVNYQRFGSEAAEPIHISWPEHPGADGVQIRAHSFRPSDQFQMDALSDPGERAYDWTSDVIPAHGLTHEDVGLLAWTEMSVAGRPTDVLLPVTASQGQPGGQCGRYFAHVWTDRTLSDLQMRITTLDGETEVFSGPAGRRLRYDAGRAWEIPLPLLDAAGLYRVVIVGQSPGTPVNPIEFLMLHSDRVAACGG